MKTNEIEYKGYIGSVEWSDEDECFYGKIKGIKSSISYDGKTINELKEDFKDAVDTALRFWESEGIKPEIPYKGSFNVRIGPDWHKKLAEKAEKEKSSINNLVKTAIIMYLEK